MKKSEAARYARWSAAVALVFAGVTLAVYLKRDWTRRVETKNAPPAAPENVERQSSHLTLSKGEGTQRIFTVEASKSTDFVGANASDLEGVKITIFGKDGQRHDTIDTHTCRYLKDSGDISCTGDVEILLVSAEQWNAAGGKAPTEGTIRIETKGVSFNRGSGEATTKDEVRFWFSGGSGQGTGAAYNSEEGTLRVERNVKLELEPPPQPAGAGHAKNAMPKKKEPVEVTGTRMDFSRDKGSLFLSGPAEAKTSTGGITAAALLLELDASMRAKRLIAKSEAGRPLPEFSSIKGAGKERISAEEIVASLSPQGWITSAEANGQVSGESDQGEMVRTATAQSAFMEMVPGENEPKTLVLKGSVDARTKGPGRGNVGGGAQDTRRLTTEELRMTFLQKTAGEGGPAGAKLASADTPGPGRIEWNEAPAGVSKGSQTVVQANQLAMRFDAQGKPARLDAKGNVRTERQLEGAEAQTATAKNGFVELDPAGGWSRMELGEDVKLNEGARSAQADHGVFERAEQVATLTGHAMAKDATSITTAKKLMFWQQTGEVRGEGGVRSTDLSARSGAVHLAPVASHVTADHLTGNSKSGRALYTGHARLWQGDSVLEAESIELFKNERMMKAAGKVRAVFPQAQQQQNTGTAAAASANPSAPRQPVLWHAQSAQLTYWDQENRARLEQDVVVQSPDERINSAEMDVYFTPASGTAAPSGDAAGGMSATAAPPTGSSNGTPVLAGEQQIDHALANGNVVVVQGDRRATAEHGVYTAKDGKFVMTGGTPTIYDANEGTTKGRQLTFFLADATIIVDSENGSRTLTKHRVEK